MKVTQYFLAFISAAVFVSASTVSQRQMITLDKRASKDVGAVYCEYLLYEKGLHSRPS